ncbi:MAG TPA: Xaa-Pro aminopeptidase [Prolixibacteraceae bacterium]|nr:Xaa-Pro aminopeptidase [Prolixibacteraceae bacterium]
MFSAATYTGRRNLLKSKALKGIAIFQGNNESPMNYPDNTYHFRQDSNFLYFFGLDFPGLAAVIDFDSGEDFLFGDDATIADIIWMGPQILLKDKAEKVGVSNCLPYAAFAESIEKAKKQGRTIHYLPPYRGENKIFIHELLGIPVSQVAEKASLPLIKAIVWLRSIKDAGEIAEIEKACAVGYQMHVTAMKMAHPGEWEQRIAGTIEGIAMSGGGMTAFPIILSQNGETLHNHNHSQFLEKGRLLITDAGAESALHYASDFTRTTPVGGKFTTKQREIYEIVLAANNTATRLVKPGVTYLSVHLEVAKVIATGLKNLGLMKGDVDEAVKNGAHALFFPHGLGHMMGLDVHDMEDLGQIHVGFDEEIQPVKQFGTGYLRLGRRLQPGFVITNEPGIYFIPALIDKWQSEKINTDFINFEKVNEYRGFGGIRIEDDILVTETGGHILGERVPVTAEEIEKIMS